MNGWRHKIDSRLAVGADYSFRRVVGRRRPRALQHPHDRGGGRLRAVPRLVVQRWRRRGLPAGDAAHARRGPARRGARGSIALHGRTLFHVGYLRSYIPSFGFGGTVQNQEIGVGYRTPLFGSRHFYSDNSAVFRDDQPLTRCPAAAAAAVVALLYDLRLGTAAVGAARGVLLAGAADQPAPRRPDGAQPHRIPDRDFQACEDAVMDEPRFDPLDYVSVFNRRKWWFIVPLAIALVVGGLLVWKLPRTYQAATTIAVSAARVSPNMIGAVEIDRQERMRAVSQQLLSRTVLERTARLEQLDQNSSIDAAVSRLRGGHVGVAPRLDHAGRRGRRRAQPAALPRAEGAARHLSGAVRGCVARRRPADRQPARAGVRRGEQQVARGPRH